MDQRPPRTGSIESKIELLPRLESTSDGRKVPAAPEEEEGLPRVGDYVLVARFPSSASADVFLGYKTTPFGFLRRAVVKWVARSRPEYELARVGLNDEARALSAMDHPNVVTILDHSEDATGSYLAVEYVEGLDLRRMLVEHSAYHEYMPLEHSCYVVAELLRGLDHVHSREVDGQRLEIVHRDVSPSNILLGRDGRVKLIDFGTVRMHGRSQEDTGPGMVKGKVRYLAPEYVAKGICTAACDVYGAGVVLFELLVSGPAFTTTGDIDTMLAIVREGLDYSRLEEVQVPGILIEVVKMATQRDPDNRFAQAGAFVRALEEAMQRMELFASPTRFADSLARRYR